MFQEPSKDQRRVGFKNSFFYRTPTVGTTENHLIGLICSSKCRKIPREACNFIKKEAPTQVLFSEFCENFKNTSDGCFCRSCTSYETVFSLIKKVVRSRGSSYFPQFLTYCEKLRLCLKLLYVLKLNTTSKNIYTLKKQASWKHLEKMRKYMQRSLVPALILKGQLPPSQF